MNITTIEGLFMFDQSSSPIELRQTEQSIILVENDRTVFILDLLIFVLT